MTTPSEDFDRVRALFGDARALPPDRRAAFLDDRCRGDDLLRQRVDALLAAGERAGDFLESPLHASAGMRPGTKIGPWRIRHQLGEGGMGVVYLAHRVEGGFEQRAAIKLVRGSFANDLLRQRFLDERQILATLEHPNVARLIDGGTTEDGAPYVAIEYIEGVPIDEYCEAHRLSVRGRLELFRQVCGAVHYAHQRLVVHRDIKATNILVGGDGVPKLLDFGIAKLIDPARGHERSRTLMRMATPESASPEQLKGEAITTATDVYSLGVLLYRLLTGTSPYRLATGTESELERAVCEQHPTPPSKVQRQPSRETTEAMNAMISSDLDHVVSKALRKDPDRRYSTAEEFSEDVRRYLQGLPVLAVPDRWSYRARKAVGRNPGLTAAAALLLLSLVGGVIATTWQAGVAARERTRAERQFEAVRTLAGSVLSELYDTVVRLPGSLGAQELMLRLATEYLDRLAAEAGDDTSLRHEVASGYARLGQVRGVRGMPNLGDADASKAAFLKSNALIESIPPSERTQDDRLLLASNYLRLAANERGEPRSELLEHARMLVEAPDATPNVQLWRVAGSLWGAIATTQTEVKNYRDAKVSLTKMLAAAEAAFNAQPDSLDESRNLSLVYKRLGAINGVLQNGEDPMPLYTRALTLDQARVDRDPTRGIWRLDLSFTYESIAAVQRRRGDLAAALVSARKALDLRQQVVAADPDDDFAVRSLARGYDALAGVLGARGEVVEAIDAEIRSTDVYHRRLREHPERDPVWRDYANAAVPALQWSLDLSEKAPTSTRRTVAPKIANLLSQLAAVRRERLTAKHEPIGPTDDEMQALERRFKALPAALQK